jgi:hypothetical protein
MNVGELREALKGVTDDTPIAFGTDWIGEWKNATEAKVRWVVPGRDGCAWAKTRKGTR